MKLIMVLALVAVGCGSEVATATKPDGIVGNWATDDSAVTLDLNIDGSFLETTPTAQIAGTFAATDSNITFVTNEGSQDAAEAYFLVNGQLVIQGHSTLTFNRR